MFGLLWDMTRGYRLCPWKSPYLLWRIETYSGMEAKDIDFRRFCSFCWSSRRELIRYLRWAERMRSG
jgi:hypothetical protein